MNAPSNQRQFELEIEMSGLGQERFLNRLDKEVANGRGASTAPGQFLIKKGINHLSKAISQYVSDVFNGKPGRRPIAAAVLKDMDHDVVAYLTLRTVFNHLLSTGITPWHNLGMQVSVAVQNEARFLHFKKENQALYSTVLRSMKPNSSEAHRATVMQYAMNKFDIPWDSWTHVEKTGVGLRLVELLCDSTGYFAIERGDKFTSRHPDQFLVTISPRVREWVSSTGSRAEGMFPLYLPMVAKPKSWETLRGGGYLSEAVKPVPFVRHRSAKSREEQNKVLMGCHLGAVYGGVNAIQDTKWAINKGVLDVFSNLAEAGSEVCGLAPLGDQPLPPKPNDIDTNKEALREWKWAARDVYEKNTGTRADRLRQDLLLQTAKRFAEEDVIYFPHSVDFRGRVYPVNHILHPQGSDEVKALLHFSEGKPLGDTGARWLAIHGANVYGEDKVSFDDRVAWVDKNRERILSCAKSPMSDYWWTEADKPWCFLAFCFEWLGYTEEGSRFRSHLPIALDGSCNGLQHFSAMLLDEVGGVAVNLTPSETPMDIYQTVADETIKRLKVLAASSEDEQKKRWAHEWYHFGLDRKITKRPVMVLPYGGTPRSCYQYVRDAVYERIEAGYSHNFGDDIRAAIGFLSSVIWDSIGSVVIAARSAMAWLQKTSRVLAKSELPIIWTSPSGFMVRQAYPSFKKRVIKTQLAGSIVRLVDYTEKDEMDKSKQATSISPNFVHSLDAAAMVLTVDKLSGMGVTSFAMIHDSYGVHAADTDLLAKTLRETFVEIYETDPLAHFRDELIERYPKIAGDIPPLPPKGVLNLDLVNKSDFFFA